MVICYISLGSNIGDRHYYIQAALKKIKQLNNTKVGEVSRIVETEPEGGPPQGLYLNAVAQIHTDLFPYQLLIELQKIEKELGRVRTIKDGPRTIDLDILTYGEMAIDEEALHVPHPGLLKRMFVTGPLKEVAPSGILKKIKGIVDKQARKSGKAKSRAFKKKKKK